MSVSEELLGILACPKCKGPVGRVEDAGSEAVFCPSCALRFMTRDGIPIMLIDEAVRSE